MEIQKRRPTDKGTPDKFMGDVYLDLVAEPRPLPSRMTVMAVKFMPGARTAWHSHAVGQTLHVTEGIGLIQARGGEVVEILPGQTIYTPPGEEHWHGACPDHWMEHLAMWEAAAEGTGPDSTWLEHVTEEEYTAGR